MAFLPPSHDRAIGFTRSWEERLMADGIEAFANGPDVQSAWIDATARIRETSYSLCRSLYLRQHVQQEG